MEKKLALFAPKSFATSNFKAAYTASTSRIVYTHELLGHVHKLILAYCSREKVPPDDGESLFKALQNHVVQEPDLLREVPLAAQFLWTSERRLPQRTELCSIINAAIRFDEPNLIQHAAPIARCINELCVVRKSPLKPLEIAVKGECFRGTTMPPEHVSFFSRGKMFRVPGFLATSVSELVAYTFASKLPLSGAPLRSVVFCVKLDPRGATDVQYRCMQVNLIERSANPYEQEFLFAPYSTFKVIDVTIDSTGAKPILITLEAALDNLKEPEDLPLATWY